MQLQAQEFPRLQRLVQAKAHAPRGNVRHPGNSLVRRGRSDLLIKCPRFAGKPHPATNIGGRRPLAASTKRLKFLILQFPGKHTGHRPVVPLAGLYADHAGQDGRLLGQLNSQRFCQGKRPTEDQANPALRNLFNPRSQTSVVRLWPGPRIYPDPTLGRRPAGPGSDCLVISNALPRGDVLYSRLDNSTGPVKPGTDLLANGGWLSDGGPYQPQRSPDMMKRRNGCQTHYQGIPRLRGGLVWQPTGFVELIDASNHSSFRLDRSCGRRGGCQTAVRGRHPGRGTVGGGGSGRGAAPRVDFLPYSAGGRARQRTQAAFPGHPDRGEPLGKAYTHAGML